jgi:hypothetical protein
MTDYNSLLIVISKMAIITIVLFVFQWVHKSIQKFIVFT